MKRKTGGKLLSVLLTLAMLAALLPGMSLTARADAAQDGTSEVTAFVIDSWSSSSSYLGNEAPGDRKRSDESEDNPTYYRLGSDITAGSGDTFITVGANRHAVLDLNGKKLDRGLTEAVNDGFVLKVGGDLTVTDSSAGKTGMITGGNNALSCGGVEVDGMFTLAGGAISGNRTGNSGGGVYVAKLGESSGVFVMEGGTISGNEASGESGMGGGVYLDNDCWFHMTDGAIGGDTAAGKNTAKYGGGVFIGKDAAFFMEDGTLSGNTATGRGGGVYVDGDDDKQGWLTMEGGTISGNEASGESGMGGGVYMAAGGIAMSGDSEISGNSASGENDGGGGVYMNAGRFTMSGDSKLSGNTTAGCGGGARVNGGTFAMYGGTVGGDGEGEGNTANKNGGGVFMSGGTFTVEDGTISGNEAKGPSGGGGVFAQSGPFTMSGGRISGNKASGESASGGGVYVRSGPFTLSGGTISGNRASGASASGGGVYVYRGTLNLSGAMEINGNKAGELDSNVLLSDSNTVTVSNTLRNTKPIGVSYSSALSENHDFTGGFGAKMPNADPSKYFKSEQDGYGVFLNQTSREAMLAQTVTVTFDANGGTGTMQPQGVLLDGESQLAANGFTWLGHVFDSWNTAADGAGTRYTNRQKVTLSEAVTLYAIWRDAPADACTMTFDSDGGSAVAAQTVEKGAQAVKPADPTLAGYRFLGWFVNPTQQTLFTEDGMGYNIFDFEQPVTDDVTLKAVWVAALHVEKSGYGRIDHAAAGQTPELDAPYSFIYVTAYKGIYDTITVAAQADRGSRFVRWRETAGNTTFGTEPQFTLTVTEDLSLVAEFELAYYSVSGRVTMPAAGGGSTSVTGATVTLRGSEVVYNLDREFETTTDENGSYSFAAVPCGRYNLTVTGNGRSKTEYVEVEDGDQTVNVILPSYPVSSVVEVRDGTPAAVVIGLDDAAADSLTDEEKAYNVAVAVTMTISHERDWSEDSEEEPVALTEEQKKITEADTGANAARNLRFFDLSLVKTTVAAGSPQQSNDIHETKRVLEILLPYTTEGRVFRVYRYHENQLKTFTRLAARPTGTDSFTDATFYVGDGFIALYTDRFSTYAIGSTPGYAVTFDANGGTGTMVDQAVLSTAQLIANAFTRAGYTFAGWNTKADGSGTFYADGAVVAPDGDLTLYAQWQSIPTRHSSDNDSDSDDYLNRAVKPDNGTVSVNRDTASKDEKVTVTVRPDEGYEVDTVTVGGSGGRSVSVTKVNDSTYTYLQPGMDVKINVTFRAISVTDEPETFSDVNASDWYADAVRWALNNGVMNGVGNGKFDPNGETSRAMVVTMLWRLEGSPASVGQSSYADVENADWYGPAVRWADAEGIVTGYEQDGEKVFNPNGAVKREQLATMLYRYAQHKGQGFTGLWSFQLDYHDASSVSDWAYEAMCWLTMNGVINGMDGKLAPAAGASRAQVAAMFMRYQTGK